MTGKSLGLFMISVLATTATKLAELKPIRRGLLILGLNVVAALALITLKHNIIAWHNYSRSLFLDLIGPISPIGAILLLNHF